MSTHNTAFVLAHPRHCTRCGGWGGSSSPGTLVPYGSTSVRLPDDWDECPACVGNGFCPWCGSPLETRQTTIPADNMAPQPILLPFDACTNADCGWTTETEPDGLQDDEPDPYSDQDI